MPHPPQARQHFLSNVPGNSDSPLKLLSRPAVPSGGSHHVLGKATCSGRVRAAPVSTKPPRTIQPAALPRHPPMPCPDPSARASPPARPSSFGRGGGVWHGAVHFSIYRKVLRAVSTPTRVFRCHPMGPFGSYPVIYVIPR